MRLLHPQTLKIVATQMLDSDFDSSTVSRKQVISHAWSECLKYLATRQNHPKMFLEDQYLAYYMSLVNVYGTQIGCKLNSIHVKKYYDVWTNYLPMDIHLSYYESKLVPFHFNSDYLFSDAVSLYFKGLNIFPYIFGDSWRKYCPVISLKEINRQVNKTLSKEE